VIRRRAVAGLIAGLIAGGSAVGAAGPVPAAERVAARVAAGGPRAAPATSPVELRLARVAPTALTPGQPLTVVATARNLTSAPIRKAKMRLRLRSPVLTGRAGIDTWLGEGEVLLSDRTPKTTDLPTIAPGRTVGFSLTVPAGQSGLGSFDSFGPRAIALEARVGDATLTTLRSTVVWEPAPPPSRTRLSLIVPITGATPSTTAGQPTRAAADALQPGGRLQRLLDATSDRAIAWALDPALLAAAARIVADGVDEGTGTAGTPTGAPIPTGPRPGRPTPSGPAKTSTPTGAGVGGAAAAAAQDWLAAIRAGRPRRGVYGLPFADPDLSSLLHSRKSRALLRNADALGRAATREALDQPVDTDVAWPGDGRVTTAGVEALARAGRNAVILSAANQPPANALDFTPSGRSTVGSGAAQLAGLLYDPQLSALVAAGGAQDAATSAQTLLAQLAAITLERPGDTRHVLAALPRTWDPNPVQMQSMMSSLRAADWVSLRGVNDMRSAAPGVSRGDLVNPKRARRAELPIGQISTALTYLRNVNTFAPALMDPEPVVRPLRERIASLLSYSWRSRRDDLASARSEVADDVDGLVGGVRLLIGTRTKTLTARSARIPLYVDNATAYPVRVTVKLVPKSGQLAFVGTVTVDAPPKARSPVYVPARAIANGNVTVEGKLLTTRGQALGQSQEFTVRVRPNWETKGMIVAAVVLGLLLVLGLLRGIRRDRARVPIDTVPDVDDLATRRAAGPAGDPDGDRADETAGDPSGEDGDPSPDPGDDQGDTTAVAADPGRPPDRTAALPRETR
jgi:hypothetical protein